MYENPLFKHDELCKFTLFNGSEKTGQISMMDTIWAYSGEPMVLAVREGAANDFTYIPWRAVESYKKV